MSPTSDPGEGRENWGDGRSGACGVEGTVWIKEQAGTGSHSPACPLAADQSSKSPRVKAQKPAGNVWGHFVTGALKEAGEARKRKPQPATTGTSQRSVEMGWQRGESGSRTQTGQDSACTSLQSTVIREVTGHI